MKIATFINFIDFNPPNNLQWGLKYRKYVRGLFLPVIDKNNNFTANFGF